jgi:anti-anti-sigma factor
MAVEILSHRAAERGGAHLIQGTRHVTPATQGYRLEIARSHAVLRLEPMMGQAAWGDIDRVGTEVLANVNGQKNGAWLIDLSGLEYMGSALVALVVRIWKAVQTSGGKSVVVCGQGMPQDVLKLAGLDKVWTITQTYEEGLKRLGVSAAAAAPATAAGGAATAGGFPLLGVLALVGALVAGGVLAALLTGSSIERDLALAGLFGGGGIAAMLGLVALIRERSWGRILGLLSATAGIACAIFGYMQLPRP